LDGAAIFGENGRSTIAKQTYKPSSVLDLKQFTAVTFILLPIKRWPSIWDGSCPPPQATNPRTGRASLWSSYSVLLRMGFAQPTGLPAAGELLPHHFTLGPH